MDFVEACLDEIALEGLDGITPSALWIRLGARKPCFTLALDDLAKEYLWSNVIRGNENLRFYELPKPRPPLVLDDRFKHTDSETGVIIRTDEQPEDIYPICVIKDDPDGIMGSCLDSHTRKDITDDVRDHVAMDLDAISQRWGEKFVIVASQRLRATALFGCRQVDPDALMTINDIKYAILERIGRSRYHGEVTQSKDGLKLFKMQPKSVFYVRKVLRNMGLITVQGVSLNGKLIHLTRFYTEFRPKYMDLLEDMTSRLVAKPYQRELLALLRTEMSVRDKTFKKLLHLGRNHVKSEVMKYKDAYPDSTEVPHSKKSKNVDRSVRMLLLLKPYSVIQNCDDEDDEEKDDESEKDAEDLDVTVAVGARAVPDSSTSLLCERPFLHQVFSCIEMLGGRGQSLIDLASRFGITKLDSRTICRNLSRRGCAFAVMQDEGKNRVTRFVSKRVITNGSTAVTRPAEEGSRDSTTPLVMNREEEDVCRGSSVGRTVAKTTAVTEREAVTADEKEKEELLRLLEVFPDTTTVRTLRRAKIMLTAVEQARVVSDTVLIQKKIRTEEATVAVMDRKSLARIIDKLVSGNKMRRIHNTIQLPNGQEKELVFFCVPSITDDDLLVQSALEAARQKFVTATRSQQPSTNKIQPKEEIVWVHDMNACKRYGYLSRMARLRTLHQLLWSLVYGKREDLSLQDMLPPGDQAQQTPPTARESANSLLCDDFYSAPEITETEERSDETLGSHYTMMTWHRTLPQLPKHSGYDDGWCCVFDVLQVIPISIICQLVSITCVINGLDSFLSDPVTCMTPYSKLPVEWQKIISHKRRYITHFYADVKSLAQLGLLTFGKRNFKAKEQCYIYIHRRSSLVNTTRSDIPRSEWTVTPFTFDTFASVEDFWLSLQSLSFNTPRENLLAFSKGRTLNNSDGRFDDCLAEKEVGSVIDSGVMPGDGMGGGGTDSTFFSHLRRNWSRNTDIDVKMESLITDGQYLVNERAKTRAMQGKTKGKEVKPDIVVSEITPKVEKESTKTKTDDPSVKFTKEVVTGVMPKKGGKGVKRKHKGIVEGLLKKSRRVREKRVQSTEAEKATNAASERKRRRRHDAKDADAIRLLKRHRVMWSPQEDSLLLLCQLTNQFLSGYQKLCLVGNSVIRDIMHENLAVARDKTRLACSRRIKYMMKNSVTIENVQMYLGEALQDKELVAEFKDGKKYAIKNSAENEPIFKRCLAKIREKFRCENESVTDIPNTPAELVERLSDVKSTGYRKSTHRDVSCISDVFYSVLHSLIHSVIVLTDKIGRSRELFQLLRQYPESVLESVLKSMKNDRMLTKIKKSMAKSNRSGGIPLTSFGMFQISQRYMYFWHSNFVRNIFAVVGSSMQEFPPSPDNPTHGSDFLDLRSVASHSVITVTLLSLRLLTFETTIPEQIVVIDSILKETTVEQPKKKRQKMDDDESDLEEEALIDEVERDRAPQGCPGTSDEPPDSEGIVNATQSVLMYNRGQSSRTVLSYYRCQYVHSKSNRLISANENIFINACDIRIRLKMSEVRDPNGNCETAWANDIEAHRKIADWNRSHIVLHPKTCQMILKSIRSIYPDRTRPNVVLDVCLRRSRDKELLTSVYDEIKRRDYLGLTVYQIRETFSGVDGSDLMDHLAVMVDCKLVIRVGVTVFRYVCLEFAGSWLIRVDKNLKGRGTVVIDEEDDVRIDPFETSTATDDASTGASSSSSATNACSSSPVSVSRISQPSVESESCLQFVPGPQVTPKKRRRSEEIGDDVELPEADRTEEPFLKFPRLNEEACRETRLQLSDVVETLDCAEVVEESVVLHAESVKFEHSPKSIQLYEESFVAGAGRTAVAGEFFKPPAEHMGLIIENSKAHSQNLTWYVPPNVRASADTQNKVDVIASDAIISEIVRPSAEHEGLIVENLETHSQSLVTSNDSLSSSQNWYVPSNVKASDIENNTETMGLIAENSETRSQSLTAGNNTLSSNLRWYELPDVGASDITNNLETIGLIAENLETHSQSLTASDNTLSNDTTSSSLRWYELPDVRASANIQNKAELFESNAITSDLTKPNSDSPISMDGGNGSVCPPGVCVYRTLSDTLPSPALDQLKPLVTDVVEQQAIVEESKPALCTMPTSASLITCIEQVCVVKSDASHTSKSPTHETAPVNNTSKSPASKTIHLARPDNFLSVDRTPVTSTSKSPVCKGTKVTAILKSPAGKRAPPVASTIKSPVRKKTRLVSTSKSPACGSAKAASALKSPTGKSTPVTNTSKFPVRKRKSPALRSIQIIRPSSSPATRRGRPSNRKSSTLPKLNTKAASDDAAKPPTAQAKESASCFPSRINANGIETPSMTEQSDDSYFSSLVNSVPKVLKRPRDFLKDRLSSEQQGQTTTPGMQRSPRPIRMPSWMSSPAWDTEPASVQKSPSSAMGKRRTRLISASQEAPETRAEGTVSKTYSFKYLPPVTTVTSNSPQPARKHTTSKKTRNKSQSSPCSDPTTSPILSPVAPLRESSSHTSATPRSKPLVAPPMVSPGRKTSPVVRMATSGTCTTITIFSPEKKSNEPAANPKTTSIPSCGSTTPSPLSPSAAIGQSTVTRNSEKPRIASDTMYSSPAESRSDGLPQQSTSRFVESWKPGSTVASSEGTSSSTQRLAVPTSNWFSPGPAMGSPRFGSPSMCVSSAMTTVMSSPSTPRSQAIRIRVPASSLGSVAGTSDLARQIQEMLVKQGSLQPGQQVRLRLPPGVTLQNLGLPSPSQSPGHSTPSPGQQCVVTAGQCVVGSGQPVGSFGQSLTPVVSSGSLLAGNSASVTNQGSERNHADAELETSDGKAVKQSAANEEQSRFRLPPQLDGASDENSMDASSSDATSSSVIATADNNSVNVVATDHATVIGSLHCADVASAGDSRHLDERCLVQPLENTVNIVEGPLPENGMDDRRSGFPVPAPKGTYKKVRLIPRPWRTPEGNVNRPTLRTMLEALMLFVIETPGVTRDALVEKYTPVLQPVAIFELLEMLEEIGCLQRTYLQRSHRPALFSSRSQYQIVAEDLGKETEVFRPTPGCIVKLGQFVAQLTSGLRSGLEKE